jgi:hypothetical protein
LPRYGEHLRQTGVGGRELERVPALPGESLRPCLADTYSDDGLQRVRRLGPLAVLTKAAPSAALHPNTCRAPGQNRLAKGTWVSKIAFVRRP